MSATFQTVNADGSLQCDNLDDAKRRAYSWCAWAKRCAYLRGIDATHVMTFDEPARRITVECAGMTSIYVY